MWQYLDSGSKPPQKKLKQTNKRKGQHVWKNRWLITDSGEKMLWLIYDS